MKTVEFKGTKTGGGKLEWVRSVYGFQVLTADSRTAICEMAKKKSMDEQIANAQLIAAAPDLLEALQHIVNAYANELESEGHDENQELIDGRKAINKALGL